MSCSVYVSELEQVFYSGLRPKGFLTPELSSREYFFALPIAEHYIPRTNFEWGGN
jgi:hypothetical protein